MKYYGLASRIVTDAFALVGYKVKIKFLPWKRAYKEAAKGEKFDGTFVWFKTPEREKDFYFSDPVIKEKQVLFHLKSYPFGWKTMDDLKGIIIGGLIGFSYGNAFDKAVETGKIKVQRTAKDEQNFGKLLLGRIQVYPQVAEIGYDAIQKKFKP